MSLRKNANKSQKPATQEKRNISELKNQSISTLNLTPIFESEEQEIDDKYEVNLLSKYDMKDLASSEQEDNEGLDSDFKSDDEWKGLTSIELGKRLAALSCKIDNDDDNQDWIP